MAPAGDHPARRHLTALAHPALTSHILFIFLTTNNPVLGLSNLCRAPRLLRPQTGPPKRTLARLPQTLSPITGFDVNNNRTTKPPSCGGIGVRALTSCGQAKAKAPPLTMADIKKPEN